MELARRGAKPAALHTTDIGGGYARAIAMGMTVGVQKYVVCKGKAPCGNIVTKPTHTLPPL